METAFQNKSLVVRVFKGRKCLSERPTPKNSRKVRRSSLQAPHSVTCDSLPVREGSKLDAISRWSEFVMDSVVLDDTNVKHTAVTVSMALIQRLSLLSPTRSTAESLVNAALNDAACKLEPPKGRSELCCMADKAMVNVTSHYLERIYGRVSIEIDPRLSDDVNGMLDHAQSLITMLRQSEIDFSRILLKFPGTSAGIQAASTVEKNDGVDTQIDYIVSLEQLKLAIGEGLAVITIPMGQIDSWNGRHPDDRTCTSTGGELVKHAFHMTRDKGTKTKIVVSSLYHAEDVEAVAGVDYIVISSSLRDELDAADGSKVLRSLIVEEESEESQDDLEHVGQFLNAGTLKFLEGTLKRQIESASTFEEYFSRFAAGVV